MKRTTISLPDDLAAVLEREARRRQQSASQVTREALAEHLGVNGTEQRRLGLVGIGRSGQSDTGERAEEILAAGWGRDLDRDR